MIKWQEHMYPRPDRRLCHQFNHLDPQTDHQPEKRHELNSKNKSLETGKQNRWETNGN